MTVDETHRRRMMAQSRSRQLEQVVRMLVLLHAGLVQHARMREERGAVPSQTAAETSAEASRPDEMGLKLLEVSGR